LKVLFEKQNWSKFGDYSYTIVSDASNKKIKVSLGADHLYDPWRNPLVVRENILRRQGCAKPNVQMVETGLDVMTLPIPTITLYVSSYGGDIQTTATVPYCSIPEIVVDYLNFPKGVP
jgi:hypothetical protein